MQHCPNCNSSKTKFVYTKDNIIAYQNVLTKSYEEAVKVPRGNMEMYYCYDCTFLYNKFFDDSLVGYGDCYENDQSYSPAFQKHIDVVISKIISKCYANNSKFLEIGCGNGYFLKKLLSICEDSVGVGYDKSLKKNTIENNISLYKKYYDEVDDGNFDVIICRHVVEHIVNNNSLIHLLTKKNSNARMYIETPSLEWIIANNKFFDIFYEHCAYFSEYSLSQLLYNQRLKIGSVGRVFNEQYIWIEALVNSTKKISINPYLTYETVCEFFSNLQKTVLYYRSLVAEKAKTGKVVIWGAGAKGVTFVNLIDPNKQIINSLIDINPKKIGTFVPGTGHAIFSPQKIANDNFNTIIIMNSNYQLEIMNIVNSNNIEFLIV